MSIAKELGYESKEAFYEVLDHCPHPGCRAPAESQCKCAKSDRVCKNKHSWHKCWAHDHPRIVLAEADHSRDTVECSCDLGPSYPWPRAGEEPAWLQEEPPE